MNIYECWYCSLNVEGYARSVTELKGSDNLVATFNLSHTCSSFIVIHELDGKSWSIGTRNWRQPFQCPSSSIRQQRLKMRINIPATLKNWKENKFKKVLEWIAFHGEWGEGGSGGSGGCGGGSGGGGDGWIVSLLRSLMDFSSEVGHRMLLLKPAPGNLGELSFGNCPNTCYLLTRCNKKQAGSTTLIRQGFSPKKRKYYWAPT